VAFFPLTAFWQVILFAFGLYLLERGKFSRFVSIWAFITELGFVGVGQFYIIDGVSQSVLFLPLSISTVIGSFFTMMIYVAVVSFLDELGRDFIGRKKKVRLLG